MSPNNSFDSTVLRWSGLGVALFLAAAFALGGHFNPTTGGDPSASFATRVTHPRTVLR
jgi:hypothetical protein